MARAYNIETGLLGLADETIRVRVDKRETGAGAPVAEQTGLDVVGDDVALDERVVAEEYHGWRRGSAREQSRTRRETGRTTGDVVCGLAELAHGIELVGREDILGVELFPEGEDFVWELRWIRGRVCDVDLLSAHGGGGGQRVRRRVLREACDEERQSGAR